MGFLDGLVGQAKKKKQELEQRLVSKPQQPAIPQDVKDKFARGKFGSLAGNKTAQANFLNQAQADITRRPSLRQNTISSFKEAAPKVGLGVGLAGVRAGTGLAQDISGGIDLVSKGTGTNRVSKSLDRFAKRTDATAKENNVNGIYKGFQAPLTAATYLVPGVAATKIAAVPKVAKFANPAAKVASTVAKPLNTAVTKAATNLAAKGAGGRIAAKAVKGAASPQMLVNAGVGTLQDLGSESGKGRDISRKDVAISAGMNLGGGALLSAAPQATLEAVRGAKAGTKAVNTERSAALTRANQDGAAKRQQYQIDQGLKELAKQRRQAQAAGLPDNHPTIRNIDRGLLELDQRQMNIQAPQRTTRQKFTDPLLTAQPGLSMRRVYDENLSEEQNKFIETYADMLKEQGQGNGVSINKADMSTGYGQDDFVGKRVSSNYRDPSLGSGRLTNADWFDQARKELESGKAGYGASDDYKAITGKVANQQEFYHGTAKGNKFDTFSLDRAGAGNGNNNLHQGNAVYLTDNPQAADFFSKQATRNAKLNDRSLSLQEATGGADEAGEVLKTSLAPNAKVKELNYRPNAQQTEELKKQGFDAITFPETAFDALEGNSLSGMKSKTTVVFDPAKVVRSGNKPATKEPLEAMWQRYDAMPESPDKNKLFDEIAARQDDDVVDAAKANGYDSATGDFVDNDPLATLKTEAKKYKSADEFAINAHKNMQELRAAGITDSNKAKDFWKKARNENYTPNYLDPEESQLMLNKEVGSNSDTWGKWFREQDHSVLQTMKKDIDASPSIKDATLSRYYEHYKKISGESLSFNDFLNKDITLYRGGKTRTTNSLVSYTPDKAHANRFGDVHEIKIKPKDTYGMLGDFSEGEVFINGNKLTEKLGLKPLNDGGYDRIPGKGNQQPTKPPVPVQSQKSVGSLADNTINGSDQAIAPTPQQSPLATPQQPQTPTPVVAKPVESPLAQNTPQVTIPDNAPGSGTRKRGYGQTIANDVSTDEAVKQAVSNLSYKVRNTKDLQARAANLIKDDLELAIQVAKTDTTDVGVMVSNQLVPQLSRNPETADLAIALAKRTSEVLTKSGQTSQAANAYGKLAPESILRFTQNIIREYNEANGFKAGKELVLTPEKAQSIISKSEKLQNMPEGRAKDIATKQMLREIKEVVPSSWVAKLSSVQTIGQLLNPKTFIRNVVGNAGFGGVLENASQVVAAGIDKGISLGTGKRTVALPNLKTQAKGIISGGKKQIEELQTGVNLGPDTQFDLGDVPVFRDGLMSKVEKTLGYSLRVPDRAAYTAAFDDTVQGLMKANNLTQPTQEILEQANIQGLYRTFQDNSKAAQLFVKLKGAFNVAGFTGKDGKTFGLGDVILKYPKTPGNILDRGLDYSPVGIIKGLVKLGMNAAQGKPFDQAALSNSIGRATVGTGGLVGTGAVLGALGIITEKPSQDTDERNLQKASGLGGYQINTSALRRFVLGGFSPDDAKLQEGDSLTSYDWAQPASIPLSAGAALGKGQSAKDGATNAIAGLTDGLNSLVEQPLLRGVNDLSGNIKNKGITGAGISALEGIPSSFVPTLSNQAKQLVDNTSRNTDGKDAIKNKVINRIPFASKSLPAQVDPLGRDKEVYQNGGNNLYNVLLNPAFNTKYNPKGAASVPLDLAKKTNETSQFPRTAPKTLKDGDKTLKLDGKKQNEYQKFAGVATEKAFNELNKDPAFKKLSDADKVKKLSSQLTDINTAAKAKILGKATDDKKANKILNGQVVTTNLKPSNADGTTSSVEVVSTDARTKKVLDEYNNLDAKQRDAKARKEYDYDYKVAKAKFENDKAAGKLSRAQLINAEDRVKKLKAGSGFSKETREFYGLSKDDFYELITNDPDGNKLGETVLAYGDKLVAEGVETKNKFRNSKGGVAFGTSTSKGGGGKGSTMTLKELLAAFKAANPDFVQSRTKGAALARNAKLASKR